MFRIRFKPDAQMQLKAISRYYAVQIVDEIEKYLRYTPDRPSPPKIKILRGHQNSTYRLQAGEYRIFYDVLEGHVEVIAILHKLDTDKFYLKEE